MVYMILNSSRVLSVSVEDYVNNQNKTLTSYEFYGVHAIVKNSDSEKDILNKLIDVCPKDTEAVVDYKVVSHHPLLILYGTALTIRIKPKKIN